jgi:hypothetical protein
MTTDKKTVTPKPKKPTKKDTAAEKRAVQNFDNMVYLITSVTPEFIQTNITAINRTTLSFDSKNHIAEEAERIAEEAASNPKIKLPPEWNELVNILTP